MRFIIYIIYIYMEKIIIFVHTCHKYEESRAKKIENTLSEEDKFENAVDEYCNYYYDEESKKKN